MIITKNKIQTKLRAATHSYHVSINQHPLLHGLTTREYPLANYRVLLVAYFHLFEILEMRVTAFLEKSTVPFDYSKRTKLSWIQDDLDYFNENPKTESNLPSSPVDFPQINSVGQLIGVLYSIEGSTLGGQVISQNLDLNHNLSITNGARFFSGYADNTEVQWREFCRFAESIQNDEEQCKFAEASAILTFNKFHEILNEYYRSRC